MLLDARPVVEKKLELLKNRVKKLKVPPRLVIIRIGNDYASKKYVANKVKRCGEVGILSTVYELVETVSQIDVENLIQKLNKDDHVTAILLQLPIPQHLDENHLTNLIAPEKDVDGFTVSSSGLLATGMPQNIPCTPRGIIELLREYNLPISGKDTLIINRSNIVGKPLVHLFLQENATVTIAHSQTKNLKEKIKSADIVVTAVGKANFFTADDFSDNTTIIDVSININELGKMCGDVTKSDYDKLVNEKHCKLTPVPNGIGQMTVLELIEQTIEIAERKEHCH
jgi:methylenetetrahydrofolate dehydrogenase (NADP+)/methenyltetrahydrofolate cyclohydrolase